VPWGCRGVRRVVAVLGGMVGGARGGARSEVVQGFLPLGCTSGMGGVVTRSRVGAFGAESCRGRVAADHQLRCRRVVGTGGGTGIPTGPRGKSFSGSNRGIGLTSRCWDTLVWVAADRTAVGLHEECRCVVVCRDGRGFLGGAGRGGVEVALALYPQGPFSGWFGRPGICNVALDGGA